MTSCSVLVSNAAGAAPQRERAIVEVGSEAARLVDARVAERLVLLEIDDIDVPAPLGSTGGPPLYFRILALGAASLRVELWELGAPRGARNVSLAGSDSLRARRIALAAGELTRQLQRRRRSEIEAAAHAPSGGPQPQAPESGIPLYARFELEAGGRAAVVGPADGWVAGPSLGVGLGFSSGFALSLGTAWLAGRAPDFSSSLRWLDVGLAATQRLVKGGAFRLSAGAEASVASVRLDDGHEVGAAPPLDTWSARAGILARAAVPLGKAVTLRFGPDVGFVLRPIHGFAPDGTARSVSGLWLGGGLSVQLEP